MSGVFLLLLALQSSAAPPIEIDETLRARVLQHADPRVALDPTNRVAGSLEAARLGRALFFDARLSSNGRVSCASCHDPAHGFADSRALSQGVGTTTRNAPSLLTAAGQRWLFWDGRADSLWCQALQPIEHPDEMGGSRRAVVDLVASDTALREQWTRAFGAPPDPRECDRTFADVGKALAAYESRLVTADSPFDRFAGALARGDQAEIARYPLDARRGLALFEGRANCRACHAGPWFSDGEFHDIGVPPAKGGIPRDAGRLRGLEKLRADPFRGSGAFSDDPRGARASEIDRVASGPELWGAFRTPSLRNVAVTAPYMHEGQLATLEDVLRYYSTLAGAVARGHHGETVLQPLHLSDAEISDLAAFLRTLTSPAPAEWASAPQPADRAVAR